MEFDPIESRIFECITGSRLYGTHVYDSDYDYRGICVPPLKVLLNPFMSFNQKDSGYEEGDRCIYALGQFVKLCADANPNIIELLFVPDEKIIFNSRSWEKIVSNKHLFISKKVRHTFAGYAISQLHKVQRHRKWFIDPPKEKPERKDFGLTDSPNISGGAIQALASISREYLNTEISDELRAELLYREEKKKWDSYISWRDSRNPRRKSLEVSYGYDTKCASHLIRLLHEGKELLETGHIEFPLKTAKEILSIKNGKYSYEEILDQISDVDENFEKWEKESDLPFGADKKGITELYFEIIEEHNKESN